MGNGRQTTRQPRKRGPKPKYATPEKVSFLLEAELLDRLDRWADERGVTRSAAVVAGIEILLRRLK